MDLPHPGPGSNSPGSSQTQNDALITTNANDEITGAILNGHLEDFIDSFRVESTETS